MPQCGPAALVDAALARWFSDDVRSRHPETMDLVRRWVTANRMEVCAPIYRVPAEADPIAQIRCPTPVMTGAEDLGNSPDMAQRMAAVIPGARAVIPPGLGRMALAEDATTFDAPLGWFLSETLREPTGQGDRLRALSYLDAASAWWRKPRVPRLRGHRPRGG